VNPHIQAMPLCNALAADPARFQFANKLQRLLHADDYEEKLRLRIRIGGMIAAYMETGIVTMELAEQLDHELNSLVWGPSA
jgi:hypothetical protein